MLRFRLRAVCVVLAAMVAAVTDSACLARQGGGAPPDYGIDFVTITSPGNTPYTNIGPDAFVYGRGSVPYEYRIGRFETTTAEWMEFVNTFTTQAATFNPVPLSWGAIPDAGYNGPGARYVLGSRPNAGRIPISVISWRSAALYANWLNNGKPTTLADIQYGAYDASTFTRNPDGTFNDQRTHNPDARFWIPTLDELMKAAYFDPNRYGDGQEGWWEFNNRSDVPAITGPPPPGPGETSAGLITTPPFEYHYIPLGAYANTTTPWGLFDASGGSLEWTEETFEEIYGRRDIRVALGSQAGPASSPQADEIWRITTAFPIGGAHTTIRIASVVPAPSVLTVCVFGVLAFTTHRRSRPCCHSSPSLSSS